MPGRDFLVTARRIALQPQRCPANRPILTIEIIIEIKISMMDMMVIGIVFYPALERLITRRTQSGAP